MGRHSAYRTKVKVKKLHQSNILWLCLIYKNEGQGIWGELLGNGLRIFEMWSFFVRMTLLDTGGACSFNCMDTCWFRRFARHCCRLAARSQMKMFIHLKVPHGNGTGLTTKVFSVPPRKRHWLPLNLYPVGCHPWQVLNATVKFLNIRTGKRSFVMLVQKLTNGIPEGQPLISSDMVCGGGKNFGDFTLRPPSMPNHNNGSQNKCRNI